MDPPLRPLLPLLLALAACSPHRHVPLQEALPAAIAALPWDSAPPGADRLCSATTPCDTLLLEPRVVRLPSPAPAFFVPAARPLVLNLSTPPAADFRRVGRPVRFADWGECLARRFAADWPHQRVACIALGIATNDSILPDSIHVAVLGLTPAQGLVWPRIRGVVVNGRWEATLTSYATQ
jgi:hypothetical protein